MIDLPFRATRRGVVSSLAAGAALLLVGCQRAALNQVEPGAPGTAAGVPAAAPGATREIRLAGPRVTLGTPRVVAEGVGFVWFPTVSRFANGDLLAGYSVVADASNDLVPANAITRSRDGGATWAPSYQVGGFTGGRPPIFAAGDATLIRLGFHTYPVAGSDLLGQTRSVITRRERFDDGGARYTVEPDGAHVGGLPRSLNLGTVSPSSGQRQASLYLFGDVVDLGGELLTTAYLKYAGDGLYSLVSLASNDGGVSWGFRGPIAGPESVLNAKEGPDEASTIRLADGDLMSAFRVGSGADSPLARAYSSDGGRTWSSPDRLPAYSVAPCLRRIANGTLVLSTGRPGLFLWLSGDARGRAWQSTDVMAYHNAVMATEHRITAAQTTAYTDLVELAPNRLLLVYDRIPNGWNGVPTGSGERDRVYALPIAVERD